MIKYSYESNVDCIALDWTVDLNWANKILIKKLLYKAILIQHL